MSVFRVTILVILFFFVVGADVVRAEPDAEKDALAADLYFKDRDRYLRLFIRENFGVAEESRVDELLPRVRADVETAAESFAGWRAVAGRELTASETIRRALGLQPHTMIFQLLFFFCLAVALPRALFSTAWPRPAPAGSLHPHGAGGLWLVAAGYVLFLFAYVFFDRLLASAYRVERLSWTGVLLCDLGAKVVATWVMFGILKRVSAHPARDLGVAVPDRPVKTFLGVGATAFCFLIFFQLFSIWVSYAFLLGGLPPEVQNVSDMLARSAGGLEKFLMVVFALAVAPLFEEFIFRALLYPSLRAVMPAPGAVLINGALFGFFHPGTANVQCSIAVVGLALAWLYERSRNYWICVGFHALFNLAGVVMLLNS